MIERLSWLVLSLGAFVSGCSDPAGNTTLEAALEPTTPLTSELATGSIRGRVTSASGAEAGVWVIAETDEFQTRFARIVVTNEDGNYLLPGLPAAEYRVWVRGYGLLDHLLWRGGPEPDLTSAWSRHRTPHRLHRSIRPLTGTR